MAALAFASVYCVGKLPAIIVSAVSVFTAKSPFVTSPAFIVLRVFGDKSTESINKNVFVS